MTPAAHEALTIRAAIGSAAVKKTYAMRNQCAPDGRLHVRGVHMESLDEEQAMAASRGEKE